MSELAVIEGGAGVPAKGSVDLLAVARQAEQVKALGASLISSGLLPDGVKKPEAAMAIMLKGQELGLPPMYSLAEITIIQGKPAPSEQLVGTLVKRAGHKLRVIETTEKSCTVEGVRGDDPGHKLQVTFSLEDAKRAGLLGKNSWKNYPRAMLRARAKTELCRAMFEDALAGMHYVPEELGAEVDEEGRPVETQPQVQTQDEPEVEAEIVDDSPPEESQPRISQKKAGFLKGLMRDAGVDRDKIEERYGPVEDLPPEQADTWIDELQRRIDAKNQEPPDAPDDVPLENGPGRERGSGFIHEEQAEMLLELADKAGLDRDALEDELGHDLHALTRDEAKAKIDELRGRVR